MQKLHKPLVQLVYLTSFSPKNSYRLNFMDFAYLFIWLSISLPPAYSAYSIISPVTTSYDTLYYFIFSPLFVSTVSGVFPCID